MKKALRTILSLFLVLTMVVTIAACGNEQPSSSDSASVGDDFFTDEENMVSGDTNSASDSDTPSNDTQETPVENETKGKSWDDVLAAMPKSLRGTTIDVYNWNSMTEYSGAPLVIQNFEKETGIKVNWITANYDDYNTKLAALVASDEAPDVARTRTPNAIGMRSFQPLSAAKYDFSDEAWNKTLMEAYSVNGKAYATSLSNTHIGSAVMMFYNKSLIDNYDLEDPYKLWKQGKWTWDKFIDMCKDYKSDSGASFAAACNNWEMFASCFNVPGPVGFSGTKYYSLLNDTNFVKVTQNLADLFNKDKLLAAGYPENFDRGECLFYASGAVSARRKNSYFASLKNAGTLYAVPMPTIEGQSKYYQGMHEYEAYAVVSGAENATAVPYFLRYFLDAANYDMNSFFCNKQTLEVYNWCMAQENVSWPTYYGGGGFFEVDDFAKITTQQGNQIKSFIDSNSASIEKRVKDLNNALAKLK